MTDPDNPAATVKNRAVFLDRDGVLNRSLVRDGKPYPPSTPDEFEIYPEVPDACAELKKAGFLLVVVTNQPDVGRGTQNQETVEAMHTKLRQSFAHRPHRGLLRTGRRAAFRIP